MLNVTSHGFNYLCRIYIFFVTRDVIVYVIVYRLFQLSCVKYHSLSMISNHAITVLRDQKKILFVDFSLVVYGLGPIPLCFFIVYIFSFWFYCCVFFSLLFVYGPTVV